MPAIIPILDTGLVYTSKTCAETFVRDLCQYVETIGVKDTHYIRVLFRIHPGAMVRAGGTHKLVWDAGSRLAKAGAAYRLQDFQVDNTGNRYEVYVDLRRVGLTDLAGF